MLVLTDVQSTSLYLVPRALVTPELTDPRVMNFTPPPRKLEKMKTTSV